MKQPYKLIIESYMPHFYAERPLNVETEAEAIEEANLFREKVKGFTIRLVRGNQHIL